MSDSGKGDTKTVKGLWSAEEDKLLLSLIEVYGPSRWVEISQQLRTRTAKQCRERYHQNLRPNLNKTPISKEEGDLIKRLVAKHGFRWTLIAKLLNTNRSDNSIKNWWKTNVKKKKRIVSDHYHQRQGHSMNLDLMINPAAGSQSRNIAQDHKEAIYASPGNVINREGRSPNDTYSSCESSSPNSEISSLPEMTAERNTLPSTVLYDPRELYSIQGVQYPYPHHHQLQRQPHIQQPHLQRQIQPQIQQSVLQPYSPSPPMGHLPSMMGQVQGSVYSPVIGPQAFDTHGASTQHIYRQQPVGPFTGPVMCSVSRGVPVPLVQLKQQHIPNGFVQQTNMFSNNSEHEFRSSSENAAALLSSNINANTNFNGSATSTLSSSTTVPNSNFGSSLITTDTYPDRNMKYQSYANTSHGSSERASNPEDATKSPQQNKLPSFEQLTETMNLNHITNSNTR